MDITNMDGTGWMTAEMHERLGDYAATEKMRTFLRSIRRPVPDLKTFVTETGHDLQKIQILFRTQAERDRYLPALQARYPELLMTSSYENNIEINQAGASKGQALEMLCRRLGLAPEKAMAFGDGTNDISMLRAAGTGVAMGNAPDCVRQAADHVTGCCDDCGVAQALETLVL